jgi:hypothetical protein
VAKAKAKAKARRQEKRLKSPLGKWRTELTTSPVGSEMRTMGEGGPSEEGLGL